MKLKLLTSILVFASITLFSQESPINVTYTDSVGKVATKENYKFKRVVEYYKNYKDVFLFSFYLKSGTITMKAVSYNKEKLDLNGPVIEYFNNGKPSKESNFSKNKKQGKEIQWYENGGKKSEIMLTWNTQTNDYEAEFLQYWDKNNQQKVIDGFGFGEFNYENYTEKGEVKNGKKQGPWIGKNNKEDYTYTENYNDGKLIFGTSEDAQKNKYNYKEIREFATYKSGMKDFHTFIGKNFKTPTEIKESGKIISHFEIDKEGNLINIKISKDLGSGSAEEAIRVLSKSDKWMPEKKRGIPFVSKIIFPISVEIANGNKAYNYQKMKNLSSNTNNTTNKKEGKEIQWYENGEKKSELLFNWDKNKEEYEVEFLQYWDKERQQKVINGFGFGEFTYEEFSEKGEVRNGKKQGIWRGKNNKENYTYSEKYSDGIFISGVSEDAQNIIYMYTELTEKPTYKEGLQKFYTFIGKHFKTSPNQ
ncbi:MAG: hypothetical protein QG594_1174, partial [Bacteroidota bacterium]|nr:hypothetical protein [Bacteroidota bacterium]